MAQQETDLVLLSEVQKQGGNDISDSDLESLITLASQEIVDYLGRDLLFEDEIEEFPDIGKNIHSRNRQIKGQSLYLIQYPVHEITSVSVSGVSQTVAEVTPSDLPLRDAPETAWHTRKWRKAGKLFRAVGWPIGEVVVNYSGGYAGPLQQDLPDGVTPLPGPIKEAAILTSLRLVSIAVRDGELDLLMERSVSGWEQRWGSGSSSRGNLIPKGAIALLQRYRNRRKFFS